MHSHAASTIQEVYHQAKLQPYRLVLSGCPHSRHPHLTVPVVVLWLLTVAAGLQDGWLALAILAWSEQHPVLRLQLLEHLAQHA